MSKFIQENTEEAKQKAVKKALQEVEVKKSQGIKIQEQPEVVICSGCGFKFLAGTETCRFCGTKLG